MHISLGLTSHLYALIRVIPATTGDVLEMGVGIGSTPYLHWSCLGKRRLVSYESDPHYFKFFKGYAGEGHEMYLVDNYDQADIEHEWEVAFIDHGPNARRIVDIKRVANYAKYIVVHDTAPKLDSHYNYSEIYPLFKYRIDFPVARTHVSILSNFVDVKEKFG